MKTAILERTSVVFESAQSEEPPVGDCSQPVGNTVTVFNVNLNPGFSRERAEDAIDRHLLFLRAREESESAEDVFARLGL